MAYSIELRQVCKRYNGTDAVRDITLDFPPGQSVALAGHNGAGKSTLIKIMLGLTPPTSGSVRLMGHDPASATGRQRISVGYLPETVALYPAMTGMETLAFYARLKSQPLAACLPLLQRVGIAQAARRRVGTYSKGMRQRLALAQALLGSPRILLLDEPTTGLDPASRLEFYTIIDALRQDGATILLSSHALAELDGRVDRVIVMKNGSRIADGTMADLRRDSRAATRIRVRLADAPATPPGLPAPWKQAGAQHLEAQCLEAEKPATLRDLFALNLPIANIDVQQPGLDDMYADLLRREET